MRQIPDSCDAVGATNQVALAAMVAIVTIVLSLIEISPWGIQEARGVDPAALAGRRFSGQEALQEAPRDSMEESARQSAIRAAASDQLSDDESGASVSSIDQVGVESLRSAMVRGRIHDTQSRV